MADPPTPVDTEAARLRRILSEVAPGIDVDAELRHVVPGSTEGEWDYRPAAPSKPQEAPAPAEAPPAAETAPAPAETPPPAETTPPAASPPAATPPPPAPPSQPAALAGAAAPAKASPALDSTDDSEYAKAYADWIKSNLNEKIEW